MKDWRLDNEKFQIGDEVRVVYVSTLPDIKGMIIHIPQDVGDMWHIKTETELFAINPMCSILAGISKNIR
jgi:hypothetical protein